MRSWDWASHFGEAGVMLQVPGRTMLGRGIAQKQHIMDALLFYIYSDRCSRGSGVNKKQNDSQ